MLGLSFRVNNMESAVLYAQIKHLYEAGLTPKEIALKINLEVSAVRVRLKNLGYMLDRKKSNTCFKGHEYTPENTIVQKSTGKRQCRQCKRISGREYERRTREKRKGSRAAARD